MSIQLGKDNVVEYDLISYLQACNIDLFKVTPTVSVFEDEEVVLLHVCARQGQRKVNFDLWPNRKADYHDIYGLPMSIKNVKFCIQYRYVEDGVVDPYYKELMPKWLSITANNGTEISFSGDTISYDEEKDYQVRLISLPQVFSPSTRYLFFDTETTGLPHKVILDSTGRTEWPRLVQLSWIITNGLGSILSKSDYIIKPEGFHIPAASESIHGISTSKALREGRPLAEVLDKFYHDYLHSDVIVGHNIDFDLGVLDSEYEHLGRASIKLECKETACTMKLSKEYCKIKSRWGNGYDYPSLQELYCKLFGNNYHDAHNAASDVNATVACYWAMRKRLIIDYNNRPVDDFTAPIINYESDVLPF